MSYEDFVADDYAASQEAELLSQQEVVAPAPVGQQVPWNWNASVVLWVAGGLLGLGFAVWFLVAFTAAKARALAEAVTGNDE